MEVMHYLRASGYWMEMIEEIGLVQPFADFAWATGQGPQDAAFALLALDSSKKAPDDIFNTTISVNGYDIPSLPEGSTAQQTTRTGLIEYILDYQQKDGGWQGSAPDAETTAIILTALAPYTEQNPEDAEVSSALRMQVFSSVENGLSALSAKQDETGGFGSTQVNARVIVALNSLGVPLDHYLFTKLGNTVFDALVRSYTDTETGSGEEPQGAFGILSVSEDQSMAPLAVTPDQNATDWGLYALTSLYRALETQTSYTRFFDFSDIIPLWRLPDEDPNGGNGNENGGGDPTSGNQITGSQGTPTGTGLPGFFAIADAQVPLGSAATTGAGADLTPGRVGGPATPLSSTNGTTGGQANALTGNEDIGDGPTPLDTVVTTETASAPIVPLVIGLGVLAVAVGAGAVFFTRFGRASKLRQ
jgi:hypothetical protein